LKFISGDRKVYLNLPVKIEHEGKEYWIKKATKTNGIYLNDVPPKEENVLLRDTDNIPQQPDIQ
jgi:hypothetical protein